MNEQKSATPRVDRFLEEHKRIRLENGYFNGLHELFNDLAEFARELEREISSAGGARIT